MYVPSRSLVLGIAMACLGQIAAAHAEPGIKFGGDLRYRYEFFSRDQDASTPPDAESQASTLRFALNTEVTLAPWLDGFAELEHTQQILEDDYNVPVIPAQTIPGYPVISDPEGTELNQAFVRLKGPYASVLKVGRQEIMLNNGRFIAAFAWRQNHQSFDGATLRFVPAQNWTFDYGYLTRVRRVTGEDASNGRADMRSQFFNAAYTVSAFGTFSLYGVLLDFDTERANSTDSYGLRFDGGRPINEQIKWLATFEYAQQHDAANNPNEVDAAYLLADLGIAWRGVALRAAYNLLEGSSATNKFTTPLAQPFNGATELFLATPSLGATNHGLEVISVSMVGEVPAVKGLKLGLTGYDYSADTGSAHYGREIDAQLDYALPRIHKNLSVSWRAGRYFADELFSDAFRTSLSASIRY